jgi:competence protein ComGF
MPISLLNILVIVGTQHSVIDILPLRKTFEDLHSVLGIIRWSFN